MSTDTAVAVAHPRRAVIDRAWRAIGPGVEVLSGDDGGPLRRTVKRIIDPLVLRLRSNTAFLTIERTVVTTPEGLAGFVPHVQG